MGVGRVTTVMDFQPLYRNDEFYAAKYISPLKDVREKYPDMQGCLSGKYYDSNAFFSNQMLLGKFTDEEAMKQSVFPASLDVLNAYLEVVGKASPYGSPASRANIESKQRAFDEYCSTKDPAVGCYSAYFGKEWCDDYVRNHKYSLCGKGSETDPSITALVTNINLPSKLSRQDVAV